MSELWYMTFRCLSDAYAAGRYDQAAVIQAILDRMDDTMALNPDYRPF